MTGEKVLTPPATITETIYAYLKNAIIQGKLKPGQRLQEKNFAELFHVSTTPVREAFQRLFAERYIIINARKDVVVARATREEIREFFEVVRALDALASKKAVRKLTDKDIVELKRMTNRLGQFYSRKKISDYVVQNLRIHYKIWKACGNEFLYQSLMRMAEKYTFYGNQLFFVIFAQQAEEQRSLLDSSYQDHIKLMRALEKKDGEEVERILLSHWGKGFLGEENV